MAIPSFQLNHISPTTSNTSTAPLSIMGMSYRLLITSDAKWIKNGLNFPAGSVTQRQLCLVFWERLPNIWIRRIYKNSKLNLAESSSVTPIHHASLFATSAGARERPLFFACFGVLEASHRTLLLLRTRSPLNASYVAHALCFSHSIFLSLHRAWIPVQIWCRRCTKTLPPQNLRNW